MRKTKKKNPSLTLFVIGIRNWFDLWKCFCFMRFRVSVLGNTTIELFDQ